MDVKEVLKEARRDQRGVLVAGYVAAKDPAVGGPVEWILIEGGRFTMGTDNGYGNDQPLHEVAIRSFEMAKTLVTVEQYADCVAKGQCTEPIKRKSDYCNWGKASRVNHPVNCVSWDQAASYAKFVGGRLPSESEWEFAATSRGKNQRYPWGNGDATCERAVMFNGCGAGTTLPVCSRPAGNTEQGLCDMAGNVWQWVQDTLHTSYKGAPADGRAWEGPGDFRIIRGGSYFSYDPATLRSDRRSSSDSGDHDDYVGFRPVRDITR